MRSKPRPSAAQIRVAKDELESTKRRSLALKNLLANTVPGHTDATREGRKMAEDELANIPALQEQTQQRIVKLYREKFNLEEKTHAAAIAGLQQERAMLEDQVKLLKQRGLQLAGSMRDKKIAFAQLDVEQQAELLRLQGKVHSGQMLSPEEATTAYHSGFGSLEKAGGAALEQLGEKAGVNTVLGSEARDGEQNKFDTQKAEADLAANQKAESDSNTRRDKERAATARPWSHSGSLGKSN